MICERCKERRHDECRGGSWCDCQHQEPEPDPGEPAEPAEPAEPVEPVVNWLRQG